MKAILTLALLASLATNAASGLGRAGNGRNQQTNLHRLKRAIPLKSGGSGASPLPDYIDPNIGQSTAQINSMSTGASMSGPLAVLGTLNILASGVMAMYYFQSVNAARRAGYTNGGSYIQKRSSQNFHQKSIASFINSFR